MKVLIFVAGIRYSSSSAQHINLAIKEYKKGNDVLFLNCDKSLGLCTCNPLGNKLYCKICKCIQENENHRYLPKEIKQLWINDYIKKININDIPKFNYNSSDELRSLTYKGIDIGFAVMSTYISLTRNLDPKIDNKSRLYFDALIREQIMILLVLEMLQKKYNFQLIIFQNGRGAQFKPFLNFCQNKCIDFICTEDMGYDREHFYENNFFNKSAHDINAYNQLYENTWNLSTLSNDEKNKIGHRFFINRRNAIYSGDKIYVKDQIYGKLPANWDLEKENIVIFNSSEDEFAAISKDFDDEKMFKTQMAGIINIVEHYKNDFRKHFTLRVHPNLKHIKYKYHLDLYKISNSNLTVISANSNISTYSLMDAADKVIVFGSTAGIEAAYWGKPVINLGPAFYRDLNVVYKPKSLKELWNLLDTSHLSCLKNDNILKYGYYYMCNNYVIPQYLNIKIITLNIFGKKIKCLSTQKIFGSNHLYVLITAMMDKYLKKIKVFSLFKSIPVEES